MQEVTCSSCGGSGRVRMGTMQPMDWSFDFREGFQSVCIAPEKNDAYVAAEASRVKDLLRRLRPGDWFMNGQFSRQVLEVGMYDGWPFWGPMPSVSYVGPLGSVEYCFYQDISEHWRHKPSGATE